VKTLRQKIQPFFYAAAVLYPLTVFCALVVFKVPLRIFSLILVALGLLFFLNVSGTKKKAPSAGPVFLPYRPTLFSYQ
jgi:hypothetical protein